MSTWQRFARFNAVGGLGIGVQLGSLWLLTSAGVHYLPATILSVGAAVVHNFVWHRRWTWPDRIAARPGFALHLARFAAANGLVSLGGNVAVMAVLVGAFRLPVMAANAAAIVACGLLNYWVGDKFVFRLNPISPSAP